MKQILPLESEGELKIGRPAVAGAAGSGDPRRARDPCRTGDRPRAEEPCRVEGDRRRSLGSALVRLGWVGRRLGRFAVGGLFAYAGIVKLGDPTVFTTAVWNYRLLPDATIHAVALFLPPLEVLCGGLVIAGHWRREAYLWLILLSSVFIVAQVQAWTRGLDITCGCFGVGVESPLTTGKIATTAGLLVAVGLLARFDRDRRPGVAEPGSGAGSKL